MWQPGLPRGRGYHPATGWFGDRVDVGGTIGVVFLFRLSGFVLTWSANTSVSAPTFWWRRFARIYPAHFVALLVVIPVFYSLAPDPADWLSSP